MKVFSLFRRTLNVYKTHWCDLMLGMLIQGVVVLMSLTPLLFLSEHATAPLALLSPVLFLLLVLPLRQNAAEAMRCLLTGGRFTTPALLSFQGYGRKLCRGLQTGLWLLLWSWPWLAASVVFWLFYTDLVDGFTFIFFFKALGFGSFTLGIKLALGLYALTMVLALLGLAMHSWRRHGAAWQLPRNAARGHRLKLLGLNLLGALTLIPFLLYACFFRDYLLQLALGLSGLVRGMQLTALNGSAWLLLGGVIVLLLPALPLKELLPAVYTQQLAKAQEAVEHEA